MSRHHWVGLTGGLAALVLTACGGSPPAAAHTTAKSSPTAKPSPTVDPIQVEAAAYTAAVELDSSKGAAALNSMGTDCSTGDLAKCRQGLAGVQAMAKSFDSDLAGLTVPACLSQTNQEIRLALSLFQQGAQEGIAGIDASDASQINAGAGLVNQADTHLTTAAGLLKQASCA